jgi:conjugal transfer ATP-binding protein TraC
MADDQNQNQVGTANDDTTITQIVSPEEKNMPDWLKKAKELAAHEEAAVSLEEKVEPLQSELKIEEEFNREKNVTELSKTAEIPAWLQKVQEQKGGDLPSPNDVKVEPKKEEVLINEVFVPIVEEAVESASPAAPVEAPTAKIDLPEGMLETRNNNGEGDIVMKQELSEKPVEIIPVSVQVDEKAIEEKKVEKEMEKKKKADVFNSAKDFFVDSLDKMQKTVGESRTAGAPQQKVQQGTVPQVKEAEAVVKTAATDIVKKEDAKVKVTETEKRELIEAEKIYQNGLSTIRDLIAPSSMEIRYDSLRVEGLVAQSFYVYAYPRYLDANWLSPVINFDVTMDISQFIYPIDSSRIMRILKKKVAQMQSSVRMMAEKGMVSDPGLETALQDAEELRIQIQRGQEKLFQFGLYFTIYTEDEKKISKVAKQLESMLGGKLIMIKKADLQQEHAFNSVLPQCMDQLEVSVNMNTSPLSTTFPFSSSDLTSNEGILYGLNRHNDGLIIFDRFSLENANSVVFAKSGAGKSYAVKLEILRSMMVGTDVIVIDPENEYEALCQTVGGSYLKVSLTSDRRINPFDLPSPLDGDEVQPGDLLRSNIINLHGLLKIMLGGVSAEEEAILDKALIDVYALKGITMEVTDPSSFVPPTMEDLQSLLSTMEGGLSLSQRMQKYTVGTYSGIFNKPTNVDLKAGLMVFSIRDLEDALRPIAMYIILNYIWNQVRSKLKKRILVVDEAWTMMQHDDSAKFMFGLVKRARKYYLGIATITQDVEDFIKSPYGRPVVTNSSMQLLLKQAPAAIDTLAKVFNLTEGEKYMLLNSGVGQGLFFAGLKHVAIQIIASYTEDKIVTTNPEEILKGREGQFI